MTVRPENRQIDLARAPAFRLGPLEIRPPTREVVVGERRESLEPRVMQVLVALAARRGEVVSRDELTELCWNGRIVGDDAINRCIAALRKLSQVDGGFLLETITRVGFRLTETATPPDQSAERPSGAGRLSDVSSWAVQHWRAASAVLAVLLVIAAAGWMMRPPPTRPAPLVSGRLTVAVLPFTPLYPGTDGQQLGDAIAFSVADVLTGSSFDVVSPAKSLQFRGSAKAGAALALHADFLIDGDIRRGDGKAIAAMRLIEGSTGTIIIAGTFERPLAEAGSLPDDLGKQLMPVGTVGQGYNLAGGWDARVMAGFFKAIFQYSARNDAYGANETARSVARYAPNNAFAQSLHGTMAAYLVPKLPLDRKPAMIAEARDAAERAIRLDPTSGDPYGTLALITPLFEWAQREQYARKGLAINPQSSVPQIQLIELLQNSGRFRESEPLAEAVFKRGPYQARHLIEMINAKLWGGPASEAHVLVTRGRDQFPTTEWFAAKAFEEAAFHGVTGRAEALLRDKRVRDTIESDGSLAAFEDIAAALRDRRPAKVAAVVGDCSSVEGRSPEFKRTCFMALAAFGRIDEAFRLAAVLYPDQRAPSPQARLQRWLATDLLSTAYLSVPVTAPLRVDPRYRDLVDRVGLFQYWKSTRHPPDFCATEKVPVCLLLK